MMNKLTLAITTDENGIATVQVNASFESREAAIDFNADVAALCRTASLTKLKPTNGETYVPRGWYLRKRTQQLLQVVKKDEKVALSPEQIAHAVASAASITKSQLENAKSAAISGERADLMVKELPSNVALAKNKAA